MIRLLCVIASLSAAVPTLAASPPASDQPLRLSLRNGEVTSFLSPDTVVRNGDAATIWSLIVFKNGAQSKPEVAGAWSLERFTCSAHIGKADTAYLLNADMQPIDIAGHVAGTPREQEAISAGSPDDAAYRVACLGDKSVLGEPVADLRAAFTLAGRP